jgi:hypothetical protein
VGAKSAMASKTPHPGSHRYAMLTDPPRRFAGEGESAAGKIAVHLSLTVVTKTPPFSTRFAQIGPNGRLFPLK